MRSGPQRAAALVLVSLVVAGVTAGAPRAVTAGQVPSAEDCPATSPTSPTSPPSRVVPRPQAPAGDEPVELIVGLKKDADRAVSASRLGSTAAVEVTDGAASANAITVEVAADESAAALATVRKDRSVAYAEVNGRYWASGVQSNDPSLREQCNLRRAAFPTAWARTTGSSDVVVAVIDSGVTTVPELAGAVLRGKSFVGDSATSSVIDEAGHGTMVASVIAANTDNGAGIAAACWTCKILPVKVLDAEGFGDWDDIAQGIDYAVAQNVDVINLSLGGPDRSETVRLAVQRAVRAGITVVAAAGNDGGTILEYDRSYPAAYPSVVSVGATDGDDQPSWFSTRGSWISMAAPGDALMATTDGGIQADAGTSFASPLVAGTAALMLANNPDATSKQIASTLIDTADPIGSTFGGGRLNAGKAVTMLPFTGLATPSVRITGPATGVLVRSSLSVGLVTGADTVSVTGSVAGSANAVAIDTAAPWSVRWTPDGRDGERVITVTATDAQGDTTRADLAFRLDRTGPTVTGVSPAQSAKVRGVVTVTATGVADAYGVAHATLYADGILVGKDTTAPYSVKYRSAQRNGSVKLEWRVVDRAGNRTVHKRSIVADNTAPKVSIASAPKDKAKVKGTVKLAVSASDRYGVNRVQLLINGKVAATDRKAAYTFSVKVSKYGKKMKVRARAYDAVGAVTYTPTRTWTR